MEISSQTEYFSKGTSFTCLLLLVSQKHEAISELSCLKSSANTSFIVRHIVFTNKTVNYCMYIRSPLQQLFVNQKGELPCILMFLQVVMRQLYTAVQIIYPHVQRVVSSAAIQLFTQDDSDHSSSTTMLLEIRTK